MWVRIGIERETSCVLERVYHMVSGENEKVGKCDFWMIMKGCVMKRGVVVR